MTAGLEAEFQKLWQRTSLRVRAYMFCASRNWADATKTPPVRFAVSLEPGGYCSWSEALLAGPKQMKETSIRAAPQRKRSIRWRGSLLRTSHVGMAGSFGSWSAVSASVFLASDNWAAVALG